MNIDKTQAGFYFGIISGAITTLGTIISLQTITSNSNISLKIIAAGIIGLALGDSFSDGLGLYYSNRGEGDSTDESQTIGLQTTLYKIIFTLSFLPIMLLFPNLKGVLISIIWSHVLIIYATYHIDSSIKEIIKHLFVVWLVVIMGFVGGNLVEHFLA